MNIRPLNKIIFLYDIHMYIIRYNHVLSMFKYAPINKLLNNRRDNPWRIQTEYESQFLYIK